MFDIDSCVCFITNKVAKKMAEKFNERLIPLGMTRVQWIAMYYLFNYKKMSQKELGQWMDIKESTVVRLTDRMEKDNYVQRIKDEKDRRITYLILTETGEKRIKELIPEGEEMSKIFSENISEEEFQVFNTVLLKMMKNSK
jgi:DNA-binding MarR family transcriptional regulator